MSAQILPFPSVSPLRQALAGCMGACWAARGGADVDIETVARLHRHLSARRPGRRDAATTLRQLQAATGWLEAAHRVAVVAATEDGEKAGEDADAAAARAHDITGALGLLLMCADTLRPQFANMTAADIDHAWRGLELDFG